VRLHSATFRCRPTAAQRSGATPSLALLRAWHFFELGSSNFEPRGASSSAVECDECSERQTIGGSPWPNGRLSAARHRRPLAHFHPDQCGETVTGHLLPSVVQIPHSNGHTHTDTSSGWAHFSCSPFGSQKAFLEEGEAFSATLTFSISRSFPRSQRRAGLAL